MKTKGFKFTLGQAYIPKGRDISMVIIAALYVIKSFEVITGRSQAL
jgi:hypothetical protein